MMHNFFYSKKNMSARFARGFGGIFTSRNAETYNTIKLQPFHQEIKMWNNSGILKIKRNVSNKSGIVLVLYGMNHYIYKTER